MSRSIWLTLVVSGLLISLTPGAGAINTMANSLGAGWKRSIWGIFGQQIALVTHIIVVAAGVGVLVAGSPMTFALIRYTGAAYLVYLGIRQWRSSTSTTGSEATQEGVESRRSMIRRGVLVNLTNPKAVIFFVAFIPQFIRPDRPLLAQYVELAATIVGIDIVVMWGFFATAAKGLRRMTRSAAAGRTTNRVFGGLFVGVGLLLAAAH